jgi:hypothetical protein
MSASERNLLSSIHEHIASLSDFGRLLAECAAPDFDLQRVVKTDDFVSPLRLGRFPEREMFSTVEAFAKTLELFGYITSTFVASFSREHALVGLYASAISLAGITYHQTPESAEFGIAGKCLVLIRASEAVAISSDIVASVVADLYQHARRSPNDYWEPRWITVSLLATSLALSSRPAVRADLTAKLTDILPSNEWSKMLSQYEADSNQSIELGALSKILQRCNLA